jgi:hypothetical protein
MRRLPLLWFGCWIIALWTCDQPLEGEADWMKPRDWSGNFWGPAATRARSAGQLPPLPTSPEMARWKRWGHGVLRDGDIVFRLGDARAWRGMFPLSFFIAKATGSPFSHTGIVAVEDGSPVVYDCSSEGIRCQPFEVWMLECVGCLGVKRLRPEYRSHIPAVLAFCRGAFERQVPFDFEFRPDDSAFYCLELTEKAFRSRSLVLSEAVRIGDWEHLKRYPLTALATPLVTGPMLGRPITLEQPVYLPGNERHGIWASPLLETVINPDLTRNPAAVTATGDGISLRGDLELIALAAGELHHSYSNVPVRWMCDVFLHPRIGELLLARRPDAGGPSLDD